MADTNTFPRGIVLVVVTDRAIGRSETFPVAIPMLPFFLLTTLAIAADMNGHVGIEVLGNPEDSEAVNEATRFLGAPPPPPRESIPAFTGPAIPGMN